MGYNEYGATHNTTGALLAVKLRNAILAIDPELTVKLKNVRVNGNPMGCSGFVSDASGRYVYVSTDNNHGTVREALYRTASGPRDYTGGRNHFAVMEAHTLAHALVSLISTAPRCNHHGAPGLRCKHSAGHDGRHAYYSM